MLCGKAGGGPQEALFASQERTRKRGGLPHNPNRSHPSLVLLGARPSRHLPLLSEARIVIYHKPSCPTFPTATLPTPTCVLIIANHPPPHLRPIFPHLLLSSKPLTRLLCAPYAVSQAAANWSQLLRQHVDRPNFLEPATRHGFSAATFGRLWRRPSTWMGGAYRSLDGKDLLHRSRQSAHRVGAADGPGAAVQLLGAVVRLLRRRRRRRWRRKKLRR